MEYPSIETLYKRDDKTHKLMEGLFTIPEFGLVNRWSLTEKVDGTNVRVEYTPNPFSRLLQISGRGEASEINPELRKVLEEAFTWDKVKEAFPDLPLNETVTVFVEAYGTRVQKVRGGGTYRPDTSFGLRVFDIHVTDAEAAMGGWWLERLNVNNVADKLGVMPVPTIARCSTSTAVTLVKAGVESIVAEEEKGRPHTMCEGVVARCEPMLYTRKGERLIWKLKTKDYAERKGSR